MKQIALALAIAVGIHGLLAVGLAVALSVAATDTAATPPELELSNVELSLSQEEADAPPVVQTPEQPAPPSVAEPLPKSRPPDPTIFPPPPDIPPEMATVILPEPPPEAPARLDSPEAETPSPESDTDTADETAEPHEEADEASQPESAAAVASSPTPAPQQAQLDVLPQPKQTIKPKYPKESRQRGEEGDVLVELQIDANGRVTAATVLTSSNFPALDAAALSAAKKARFTPAKMGDKPVPATARLTLTYKLK